MTEENHAHDALIAHAVTCWADATLERMAEETLTCYNRAAMRIFEGESLERIVMVMASCMGSRLAGILRHETLH